MTVEEYEEEREAFLASLSSSADEKARREICRSACQEQADAQIWEEREARESELT